MKNLRFHELLLASEVEKTARRVRFHKDATVIRGDNDTGKSSIIKSLYRTLGAEPQNIHARWEVARNFDFRFFASQLFREKEREVQRIDDATPHRGFVPQSDRFSLAGNFGTGGGPPCKHGTNTERYWQYNPT